MSLIGAAMGTVVSCALTGIVIATVAPDRVRRISIGVLTSIAGLSGIVCGTAALMGSEYSLTLTNVLPFEGAEVHVDALSGLFSVPIGAVAALVGSYSIGYTRRGGARSGAPQDEAADKSLAHPGASSRTAQAALPAFVAAMLLVPAAANVTTFLAAWELMALASLTLVLAEHHERPSVGDAGLWYVAMTQAGAVAILVGFGVLAAGVGSESFDALRDGSASLSPGIRSVAFVVLCLAFGSKAGLVPLHVWLPRAHAEAPSHVSALMSAGMVNLGVYGVVRVGFDLLGGGPRWWGAMLLLLGIVSAVYGALQASVATDLKRLLAYSTTENMGVVMMGLGAGALFAAEGNRVLAGVLVAAALLHVVNHSAFKALLFLGAGSVLRATGLRDLDRLGGLASRMPITTALVGVGALGATALPLGNGFVSEWLLLQGLTHGIRDNPVDMIASVAMPLAVAALALTTGLGVLAFVKMFGIGFLARPRSAGAESAVESPWTMRTAMAGAGTACVVLALAPAVMRGPLAQAMSLFPTVGPGDPLGSSSGTIGLNGVSGSMSPLWVALTLAGGVLVIGVGVRSTRRTARRRTLPWGSGRRILTPRMEYTATSFAEPLTRVFDDVLNPERDVNVTPHRESRYLIESVTYRQHLPDRVEALLYPPLLAGARGWGRAVQWFHNGDLHRYLTLVFVVTLTVVIVIGLSA